MRDRLIIINKSHQKLSPLLVLAFENLYGPNKKCIPSSISILKRLFQLSHEYYIKVVMTVYICTFCMLFYVVGSTFIQIEWKKLKLFEWQGNIDMIQNWFFANKDFSNVKIDLNIYIIWALFCRVEKIRMNSNIIWL